MSETRYDYPLPGANPGRLHAEIEVSDLPGFVCVCGSGSMIQAVFADPLSAADLQTLDAVIAAHDGAPTADDKTDAITIPIRVLAALVESNRAILLALPAAVRNGLPAWVADSLTDAHQRIQEARQ